jgi:hypothetical protein
MCFQLNQLFKIAPVNQQRKPRDLTNLLMSRLSAALRLPRKTDFLQHVPATNQKHIAVNRI